MSANANRGHLPSFSEGTVGDAMHGGVVNCTPDTPMREVAAKMAKERVHSVVVTDLELGSGEMRAWGIVTDIDVLDAAIADGEARPARDCAASELLTVTPGERLKRAAQLLSEHQCTHLVVVDPETGEPVGVLSSLDLAAVVGGGS